MAPRAERPVEVGGRSPRREPVAVVGMACRFPGGADDPEAFWRLLWSGLDAVGEPPEERRDDLFPDAAAPGAPASPAQCVGGFLRDIDRFDAAFFGIAPREASRMDPQQRLLLQVAWEALEDAGLVPSTLSGSDTGVFVGIAGNDYLRLQYADAATINPYTNSGGAFSLAANRLSHALDLHGPSLAVDTACSSSLVAVHLACQALWRGEASLALAGGVNALLRPGPYIGFRQASMLSPSGRCRSFDAAADGYVRSEGAGLVVLKPLGRALADGDPVQAVILATGVNSDGRTAGIAQPNGRAQEDLLRSVYREAGVAPRSVVYVEAHGTGTAAGDPVECGALGRVLGAGRTKGRPLRIGSVKSNIGHLEAASGIAGLIKAVLCLRHRAVPANLHFGSPNPRIPFDDLRLHVQTEPFTLPAGGPPLVAGVNSFGFGGTNAHVALAEFRPRTAASPEPAKPPRSRTELLLLSARAPQALNEMARSWAEQLRSADRPPLADLCHTAAVRRSHHDHRLAVVAPDAARLAERLEAFGRGEGASGLVAGRCNRSTPPAVVFVFSGNGSQWPGMGLDLVAEEPVFRQAVAEADEALRAFSGWSVLEELRASREMPERLELTEIAQPALFAIQVGLSALWRSWGVVPQAVLGHSVGEIAAAHVAGALDLQQAARVVHERSRLQEGAAGGGMAAVGLGAEEAHALVESFGGRVTVAALNGPASVTVAGDAEDLEDLGRAVQARGGFFRRLPVRYAFHSPAMDPLREPLLAALEGLRPSPARVQLVSTVTGRDVEGTELDAGYWWANVRQPVLFASALDRLISDGLDTFVEIGPHPVLGPYLADALRTRGREPRVVASLSRDEPERTALLHNLGRCHVLGVPWRPQALFPGPGRCVPLPRYPWQGQRHWNAPPQGAVELRGRREHPLLGARVPAPDAVWHNRVDLRAMPYLADHSVHGAAVFPATGYVEMALAAGRSVVGEGSCELEGLAVRAPLVLEDGHPVDVQTRFEAADGRLRICSRRVDSGSPWVEHAACRVLEPGRTSAPESQVLEDLLRRCPEKVSPERHYAWTRERGLSYGPAFKGVEQLWLGHGEALGRVRLPAEGGATPDGYGIHPALLDACLQVAFGLAAGGAEADASQTYLPVRIGRVRLYRAVPPVVYSSVRLRRIGPEALVADGRLLGEDGEVVAELQGFRLQAAHLSRRPSPDNHLYRFSWETASRQGSWGDAGHCDGAPDPRAIARELTPRVGQLTAALRRTEDHDAVRPQLDALCAAYALRALRTVSRGAPLQVRSLVEEGGIVPRHGRFAERLLERLAATGRARPTPRGWVLSAPEAESPREAWRALVRRFPAYLAELLLVERSGEHLAEVLRGEVDPLTLLFGDGAVAAMEHLYDGAPSMRLYNLIMQGVLQEVVRAWSTGRRLRVLEIGAGTGGTTSFLLPVLPATAAEYLLTDVSETFVSRAAVRFARWPVLRASRLDIERPPEENGLPPHSFDVAVAANVLHATPDLRTALGHVRRLLAPGGLLILAESQRERWLDLLVFGQLPGWWRFQDRDLRPRVPLLDGAGWRSLLAGEGWGPTAVLSDALEGAEAQQAVVLAQAPGAAAPAPAVRSPSGRSPSGRSRTWLLLVERDGDEARQGGLESEIARRLAAGGDRVVTAARGTHFRRMAQDLYEVRPDEREDLERLLDGMREDAARCDEVVHLWGLPPGAWDGSAGCGRPPAADGECSGVVHLVQGLIRDGSTAMPRLWLVTRGVHGLPGRPGPTDPSQAPLWGLGRVLMSEHPELRCRLVDLHPDLSVERAAEDLMAETCDPDDEDEVLLAPSGRHVHRLRRVRGEDHLDGVPADRAPERGGPPFRLELGERGSLDSLGLRVTDRRPPGPGEVEIAVRAVGLNFRDVMWSAGLLDPEAAEAGFAGPTLGMECAGEVAAVGAGVNEFRVGDAVVGFAREAFARFVTTPSAFVARKPPRLGWEEAATVPVAFLTAHFALSHLARLQPDERVLIHGAAGGVGLAAAEVAERLGARVFATAGTVEKREFLRLLGIPHVMDSRSLGFAEDVLEATGGEGVDVVLNSLSGEAMARGLAVLRPFGRFVEIGKRDIYDDARLGLRPFRRSLSYLAVDVDRLLAERPALGSRLFREVLETVGRAELHALPHRVLPVSRVAEAFRYMQQSRHVGKVVVSLDDQLVEPLPAESGRQLLDPAGTYLVSGGLGGFGLATARWLARKGARHLVLMGRRGAADPEAQAAVADLEAAGVHVVAAACDVARPEELQALLARVRAELPPLRGVFHAAMVLDDGIVLRLDGERLRRVMQPKALGAWNLHRLTGEDPLDWFVCFSSATTAVGNPAQASYCAANAFLEALAEHRRRQGRTALTVSWGGISEVGYLARNEAVRELLAARTGLRTIAPAEAFAALERLMRAGTDQLAVADIDWRRWRHGPAYSPSPKYQDVAGEVGDGEPEATDERDLRAALAELAPEEARAAMVRWLGGQIGTIVGLPASEVDTAAPIGNLGVDSLMSVELQDGIRRAAGVEVPVMRVLQGGSVEELADFVVQHLPPGAGRPLPHGPELRHGSGSGSPQPRPGRLVVPLAHRSKPALRLVVIPYIIGSATAFRPWVDELPESIDVVGLELPGRPGRPDEAPYRDMSQLVRDAVEELLPHLDVPFALYGHSIGALIAHELALRLQEDHGLVAAHAVLAACHAPDLPEALAPLRVDWPDDVVQRLSDTVLADQLRELLPEATARNSDLLRRLLPAIRAELQLMASYTPPGTPRLRCPVTCIGGDEDRIVTPALIEGWAGRTSGGFRHVTVPGGHLFVRSHPQAVLAVVREALGVTANR